MTPFVDAFKVHRQRPVFTLLPCELFSAVPLLRVREQVLATDASLMPTCSLPVWLKVLSKALCILHTKTGFTSV